jgi:hypothetical protein
MSNPGPAMPVNYTDFAIFDQQLRATVALVNVPAGSPREPGGVDDRKGKKVRDN